MAILPSTKKEKKKKNVVNGYKASNYVALKKYF